MRGVILTIGLAVLLISGLTNAAEDRYFYSSGQIIEEEQWSNVYVYNDSTIVDMTGGLVDSIGSYNASTVNITGGQAYTVETWGNGNINVSGGTIGGLSARINGTITISDAANVGSLAAFDYGTIFINSGLINFLSASGDGNINLYGGKINDSLSAGENTLINIYGNELMKFQTGGRFGSGYVHGFWFDTTEFTIDLTGLQTYSHINLIPEPASFLLLSFGVFALRRK